MMEWADRLNQAVQYLEEHIKDEVLYEEAAKIACCSAYHFQRMFSYMAGITLSEYIRRRKMSLAAVDLKNSKKKILDLALDYGYDSPTAFNRAFQAIHGVSPSKAREDGVPLKAYPPLVFTITIKGVEEMEYRIVKKEAFRIIGVSEPLDKELEKNFETVPGMWQKAAESGFVEKLAGWIQGEPAGILGVSVCNEREEWKYWIAVASDLPAEAPVEEYRIPVSVWAVFPGEGNSLSIQELEKRIVTEWLPTSGYEYGEAADIEVYLNPDPQNAKYEVWIPVVKKEP